MESGFPPKIKTTTFGEPVLVQGSIKAHGGIKVVIDPVSTDVILEDHIILCLMGSTGNHLEVYIIP